MNESVFLGHGVDLRNSQRGRGWLLSALGHAIFAKAETWEELRRNVREATALHFEAAPMRPRLVQLHYVKDELIPVEAAASILP
jgi:hypothetical protein